MIYMRNLFLILALIFYPLAVHALILLGSSRTAVFLLVAISLIYLVMLGFRGTLSRFAAGTAVYIVLMAIGIINIFTDSMYALFLPPVLINLGMMGFFGDTLRHGSAPLVERLMRLEYKQELPGPLKQYARRLTWIWTGFFCLMALLSLLLAWRAPLAVWSLFANVLNYIFVAVLFLGQYIYRFLRFRQYGIFMPWHTIQTISRISANDPGHPFFSGGGTRR